MHLPKIEIIRGTMRSGKSKYLMERVYGRRAYSQKKKPQNVLVLKPSDDTKSPIGFIKTRNGHGIVKMKAITFDSQNPWSIIDILEAEENRLGTRVHCVAIDEGQFVKDLYAFAEWLLKHGYDVIVAGLDYDFRGLPFGDMFNLSGLEAQYRVNIFPCFASCTICGEQAIFPQRLIKGKAAPYHSPLIMAGDMYEPRCPECFVLPERPERRHKVQKAADHPRKSNLRNMAKRPRTLKATKKPGTKVA